MLLVTIIPAPPAFQITSPFVAKAVRRHHTSPLSCLHCISRTATFSLLLPLFSEAEAIAASMEINGGASRRKISRETSPDRARTNGFTHQKEIKGRSLTAATRKVQVVYYLSRNGQLEHPHFMEISHLAHQLIRLKDVIDRLTLLRGKGMPALFSCSCKRIYKNGYVCNDLSENDLIYPVDGAEYVLKGSEIIHGCPPANSACRF